MVSTMDADGLERLRALRFRFLETVYDECSGSTMKIIPHADIATRLDLDHEAASVIAEYLSDEGLLEWQTMGHFSLTHEGVIEIEDAIANPEAPTEHFPAMINYLRIESMVDSAVQQGTFGSTQSREVVAVDAVALRGVLEELRAALAGAQLDTDDQAEAEAEIMAMSAQVASPRPKAAILREGVATLRRVTEAAVAAGAGPQLPELVEQLARLISGL